MSDQALPLVSENVIALNRATGWFALEDGCVVRGWCMDRSDIDRRLSVEIRIDGRPVGTVVGGAYRGQQLTHGHAGQLRV